MVYEQTIYLDADTVEALNYWLTDNTDTSYRLGEDDTYCVTVAFPDGIEMDIKCCGVQLDDVYYDPASNTAWTEAVLFQDDNEICHTVASDEFLGEWSLEFDDTFYIVHVKERNKYGQ